LAYGLADERKALWFHDAARPFVSQRIIAEVAEALEQHEAVTVAIPVTDTLYHIANSQVKDIPARSEYMRAQTPQAFHYDVVFGAYAQAIADEELRATDDVGVVRKYAPKQKIYIVEGEEANRKITYKEDL
jgi:2-C-methyl-D-erythritol 4-phosphate cytidylyltransferase